MSSKLFTTRQGTVLLGVIAAIIAAIALIAYLNNYRNSVTPPPVGVLVAAKTIPQGMSGDVLAKSTSFYEVAQIPGDKVLSGAITDASTLAGTVALTNINPNSQLTEAQFGAATGVQYQLTPNERAVVVDLGSPQAVGGQIAAGSNVDLWITRRGQASNGVPPGRQAAAPGHVRARSERLERHPEGRDAVPGGTDHLRLDERRDLACAPANPRYEAEDAGYRQRDGGLT